MRYIEGAMGTVRLFSWFGRIFAVLLLSSLALLPACKGKKEAPKPPPPVPVLSAKAVTKDVPVTIKAIGMGEAFSTVSVKSLAAGEVIRVHFREGQDVKKGEVLFSIDPRPLKAALDQAEANLLKDTVQEKNAASDAVRYAELYKKGIVSQTQYAQFMTAADSAKAVLSADRAAVDTARVNLGYCIIKSPIGGRTGNLNVHEGNIVKANDTPYLVVINQITPLNVTFSVPEQYLPSIKKNMAEHRLNVEAASPGDDKGALTGTLSFVDNAVDPATGTIKLKAVFENRDRRLWPGQYVNVALSLYTIAGATLVPAQAVQTGQQGQYVFIIKPDLTVDTRPITAGLTYEDQTVVEKGLSPGETVVTDGQLRLVPGAKVELKANLK
jgi:multidrug efflux system membrane fusion protein